MAMWNGVARTNYVKITDMEGLKAYLGECLIRLTEKDGKHAFISDWTDDGGFPTSRGDEEKEFDFAAVMKYIAEGEVLVTVEAGHEKMRYITGETVAYIRRGDAVNLAHIRLGQIYKLAAEQFGVEIGTITVAEY